jgi:eukaryotic-like serine/threonine-protein kinase
MTPERWQQIERLYHSALEREESQRAAYLNAACAGDESLVKEVESLLAQDKGAQGFLEAPAIEVAAKILNDDRERSLLGRQMGCYQILSLLGAGGMGEVYLAHDSKLRRDVAIKVLPAAFVHDSERLSRFQREARMLAALNHPNIATIYGLEQWDGVHYLVMELVPGKTLAERVKRGGPVPIEEALTIAKQIAEALEAAHEKGIIHRDLKPANVKVTPEGRVKVLDFGLAKAFAGDVDLPHAPTLSQDGRIMGTPAYMSPEQARGKPVDKRADIWAFGCVLYELLSGKQAFPGDTLSDCIAAVLEREPDWQALPAATPAKIRDLLRRCLQKDAQRRQRDSGDARIEIEEALALKRDTDSQVAAVNESHTSARTQPWWRGTAAMALAAAVGLLAVLAGAGWFYRSRMGGGEPINSLAVLPFVNGSGDPNMEYLSDGISESLINSLSQLPQLEVKSRDSAFHYKGKDPDPETVGRELGVRAVFKGRVTQLGDNLAISAELIDARNNDHIWGEQYDRKTADIFALQGDIAKEITAALRLRLTSEDEKRVTKSYTANPEAYQLYLQGRFWWNKRSEEGFNKGIEYFQQAIAKDPSYALAYTGLADSYSGRADYGFIPPNEAFPKAKEAALTALKIDDTLAEAHASLALIKTAYDWDWPGAERESQRAIELNPSYLNAHYWFGMTLMTTGRLEEAIAELKRALELDPLSLIGNRTLGEAFFVARQDDQAIEQERKTLELDPNFIRAHLDVGVAYLEQSKYKEGIAEFEKELVISPSYTEALSWLGYAYAVAGRRAEAQKVLHQLSEFGKQRFVPAPRMARIYAGLGEKDKAIEWLEKGYGERSTGGAFANIKVDPAYDSLRSDPRFADLLRRMNLQP